MPYDDSEIQKTYDTITGNAFGYSFNGASAAGSDLKRLREQNRTGASPPKLIPSPPKETKFTWEMPKEPSRLFLNEKERKELMEDCVTMVSLGRNDVFGWWLFIGLFYTMVYVLDHYLPALPWWAATVFVLSPPAATLLLIDKFKLFNQARKLCGIALVAAMAIGTLYHFDLAPNAADIQDGIKGFRETLGALIS